MLSLSSQESRSTPLLYTEIRRTLGLAFFAFHTSVPESLTSGKKMLGELKELLQAKGSNSGLHEVL